MTEPERKLSTFGDGVEPPHETMIENFMTVSIPPLSDQPPAEEEVQQ